MTQTRKLKSVAMVIASIIFLPLNIHAQCMSPNLIQQKGKILVIDNYPSGLYQWVNIHKADTFTLLCSTADPDFINPMKGDKVYILKYCTPEPQFMDGINFINFAQDRIKNSRDWVTSNQITVK
jgi:hypothetical protein